MVKSTASVRELVLAADEASVVAQAHQYGRSQASQDAFDPHMSHDPSIGVIAQATERAFWAYASSWYGMTRLPVRYDVATHVVHLMAVFASAFMRGYDERQTELRDASHVMDTRVHA